MMLLKHSISRDELKKIAKERFITLVKAVVDLERKIKEVRGDFVTGGNIYKTTKQLWEQEFISYT